MKAVSLFSGCGGFDLGMERAGIEIVLQCELDPAARSVLKRHWPDVPVTPDVRDVQFVGGWLVGRGLAQVAGGGRRDAAESSVDLVFGGFPCQPFSVAGGRAGADDDRNLWPQFRRVVSELRPRWIVAENVPGLLSIHGGAFFASILDDLAELGFDGVAWAILDAQHFGVPQRRRRLFLVGGPCRRCAEQVLALCESCGGHSASGRTAGEGVARSVEAGFGGAGLNSIAKPLGVPSHRYSLDLDFGAFAIAPKVAAPLGSHKEGGQRNDLDNPKNGLHYDDMTENFVVAFAQNQRDEVRDLRGLAGALAAEPGMKQQTYLSAPSGVRRLTPTECERLQSWPDGWTAYGHDGKAMADSVRYRLVGNGVVSNVAEWIGRRLLAMTP